ncbi:MAG: hypothetical protein KJN68_03975 [Bacteroidia bacterium]|nr:hypothetical protein [Bacteroidia bacterium]
MFLVTCYKINCETPHFYVNPKGGKIPLVTAPDAPDAPELSNLIGGKIPLLAGSDASEASNAIRLFNAQVAAKTSIKLAQKEPYKYTAEEIQIILEWYGEVKEQLIEDNLGVSKIKKPADIIDYLVIQCASGHKNYIPLKEEDK